MPSKFKVVAILVGVALFLYIIELVRRRKLREEYSWFWMLTGVAIVIISVWYDLLRTIGQTLGGVVPSAVLFFFGMIYLILIGIHQSVKISRLTNEVKTLAQEIAILKSPGRDA